jgi:hypothetical protein
VQQGICFHKHALVERCTASAGCCQGFRHRTLCETKFLPLVQASCGSPHPPVLRGWAAQLSCGCRS